MNKLQKTAPAPQVMRERSREGEPGRHVPAAGAASWQQQIQLALSLLQRGDASQGLALLTWLSQQGEAKVQASLALAQVHLGSGQADAALPWAQRAAEEGFDAAGVGPMVALMLSRCLRQVGQADRAVVVCRQALDRHPRVVDLHVALALAHKDAGQLDQSAAVYLAALQLAPDRPDLHHNLGNVRQQQGDLDGARQSYLAVLALAPEHAPALLELAHLAQLLGQQGEAHDLVRRALTLAPQMTRGWRLLARLLQGRGQWSAAREAWEAVVGQDAREPADWLSLAQSAWRQGDAEAALAAHGEAAQRAPDLAAAHHGRALVLRTMGRLADAMEAIQQAIACQPEEELATECLYLRTALLLEMGQVSEAQEPIEQLAALAQHPFEQATALELRAAAAATMGDMAACLAWRQQSLSVLPERFLTAQSACAAAQYLDTVDGTAQRRITEDTLRPFWPRQDAVWLPQSPAGKAVLRVGFVSADLRRHSCAFFLEPLWQALDHGRVRPFVYAASRQQDAVTQRLKGLVADWREVAHLDAAGLREAVRADGIDILIDLSGHTEGSRLDALALRCAPVQMAWLGYLSTTGMPSIDARLSDAAANPPEHDAQHTERVVRMGRPYVVYRPDAAAPDVVDPPALERQHITFGSFNTLQKISPACIAQWSRLLARLPTARLLLKARPFADAAVRSRLTAAFEAHGVTPDRLSLLPHAALDRHHLETYGQVDIALDTWPYQGVTTTCEALWMGVPVVSRCGASAVSRQSLTLLPAVGLGHLALPEEDAWVDACVALSRDVPALKALRHGLRARMAASPLMDAEGFARAFEDAMHGEWRRWCGLA